ncbi:MAG: 50S ribosomal protein L21 [Candidatus Paceibacterota bacterium]|jgi:large subunit ribosomal protein L21|nr:50S ribosomal protein L21 [bacterium]
MIAVIKTGGKQYKVAPGQKIKIEKIDTLEGEMVTFDEVLLVGDEKIIDIGTPTIEGATVTAKVIRQDKGEKIVIFKYKPKKRYKVKKGHRQFFTEIEITDIKS